MKIFLHPRFVKESDKLPKRIRTKLAFLLEVLAQNPFNDLLHTKKLAGDAAGFLSFRVTRDWRVIFYFQGKDTIEVLKVAHRKDVYK